MPPVKTPHAATETQHSQINKRIKTNIITKDACMTPTSKITKALGALCRNQDKDQRCISYHKSNFTEAPREDKEQALRTPSLLPGQGRVARRRYQVPGGAATKETSRGMWGPRIHKALALSTKKKSISRSRKKKKIFIQTKLRLITF